MRYPQLVIHEEDGALARALRPLAEARTPRWVLRQPRRLDSCLRLLGRGHPSVLVLKAGHDVVREMTLVERVGADIPEAGVVVIAAAASPALAGVAWHLGAGYVFTAEPTPETLVEVVQGLMERSCEKCLGAGVRGALANSGAELNLPAPPAEPEDDADA
jgi:hypothetical protein